jgi:hypothetical protein
MRMVVMEASVAQTKANMFRAWRGWLHLHGGRGKERLGDDIGGAMVLRGAHVVVSWLVAGEVD